MEHDTHEEPSEGQVADWNEHDDHADGADAEEHAGAGTSVDELSIEGVLADLACLVAGRPIAMWYHAELVEDGQGGGKVLRLVAIDDGGFDRTFTLTALADTPAPSPVRRGST